jgi:hypothetical protein
MFTRNFCINAVSVIIGLVFAKTAFAQQVCQTNIGACQMAAYGQAGDGCFCPYGGGWISGVIYDSTASNPLFYPPDTQQPPSYPQFNNAPNNQLPYISPNSGSQPLNLPNQPAYSPQYNFPRNQLPNSPTTLATPKGGCEQIYRQKYRLMRTSDGRVIKVPVTSGAAPCG